MRFNAIDTQSQSTLVHSASHHNEAWHHPPVDGGEEEVDACGASTVVRDLQSILLYLSAVFSRSRYRTHLEIAKHDDIDDRVGQFEAHDPEEQAKRDPVERRPRGFDGEDPERANEHQAAEGDGDV